MSKGHFKRQALNPQTLSPQALNPKAFVYLFQQCSVCFNSCEASSSIENKTPSQLPNKNCRFSPRAPTPPFCERKNSAGSAAAQVAVGVFKTVPSLQPHLPGPSLCCPRTQESFDTCREGLFLACSFVAASQPLASAVFAHHKSCAAEETLFFVCTHACMQTPSFFASQLPGTHLPQTLRNRVLAKVGGPTCLCHSVCLPLSPSLCL